MPEGTSTVFDHLGIAAWVPGGLFVASLACAVVGLRAARKPERWPHWASLVSGLGRTVLLLGVVMSLTRFYWGFREIAQMRTDAVLADVAGPVADGLALIIAGAWVSLASLGLAALVRLREDRPRIA